jgi:YebC/PmpR family DNA-binding regulatory protein
MVAARQGGPEISNNLKLQYAVEKAKQANIPKDTIERAIKKASGELQGTNFEEVVYEGYGPGGIAIMIEALTDNKNRTAHEIRHIMEKHDSSLGSSNCVSWLFERKGLITIALDDLDEDQLMADALEAGAENMQKTPEVYEITSTPQDFERLKKVLSEKYTLRSCEITLVPKTYVKVGQEEGKRLLALMEALDQHDDVQNVYANFELPAGLG